MKLSRILLCLSLVVPFTSPSHAQTDTLEQIRQAHKIRVAIDLGNHPYGFKNEKLEAVGVDVEVAKQIAQDLHVQLEIVPTTGPNRIPFLLTDKADIIISTLGRRPEREKVIDYTSAPYGLSSTVVGAPESLKIKTLADLKGRRVAVTRATTNDTDITQKAPEAVIVRFDDEATTLTALVTNQVDIIVQSPEHLTVINERNPARKMEVKILLGQNHFGMGLRKGNPQMKKWLDQWTLDNLANGKLNKIYKKYHGIDLPANMATVWK